MTINTFCMRWRLSRGFSGYTAFRPADQGDRVRRSALSRAQAANRGRAIVRCLLALALLLAVKAAPAVEGVFCARGSEVVTDIGEGVMLRTCLWERSPAEFVRTGRLELIKNGVVILKARTNLAGKLHGEFVSLSDEGVVMEHGNYVDGLKEGPWQVTDGGGTIRTLRYQRGKIIEP